jgi:polysaccharide chain length determinant protein (PEP-CTERM system associated)
MDEIYRKATIILRGMWNYRWFGLAVAWAVGVAGFVLATLVPEYYEASARIFVNTDTILKPLMTGLTVQPNEEQRIVMVSRVVISRPNVDRLVKEVGLDEKVETREQREALIDSVMKRLQFKPAGRDNNIYMLTFRDTDPKRGKRAVEMLAGMFMDQSQGGKTADTENAKRFIDEQIAIYDEKLREAENRLKEFRTQHIGNAPGEGSYFVRMSEAETALNRAKLELREAERGREALRRGMQNAEAAVAEGAPVANELDTRIDTMRRNLDAMLQRFTEEHPDVQGARRMIADLEAQRAQYKVARRPQGTSHSSGSNIATEQLRIQLTQSEAAVAALTARVAEHQARYDRMKAAAVLVPKLEAELAQLNRDYEVNKRNYESLVARREAANISGEMQAMGLGNFRMVDPPRVSPRPLVPRRVFYVFALGLAFIAGIATTWIARELRPSFYDGRSLRDATGLPLLGVVSLNLTDAARSQRRRSTIRFLGGVGALVGVYAVGLVALRLIARYGLL